MRSQSLSSIALLLCVINIVNIVVCHSQLHLEVLSPFSYDTLESLGPDPYSPPVLLEATSTQASPQAAFNTPTPTPDSNSVAFPFEQPPLPDDLAERLNAQNPVFQQQQQPTFMETRAVNNAAENDLFETDDGLASRLQDPNAPVEQQQQQQAAEDDQQSQPQQDQAEDDKPVEASSMRFKSQHQASIERVNDPVASSASSSVPSTATVPLSSASQSQAAGAVLTTASTPTVPLTSSPPPQAPASSSSAATPIQLTSATTPSLSLPPLPSIPSLDSASSGTPVASPEYYKCVQSGGSHGDCVIRYPSDSIQWKVAIVPKVENAQPQANVLPLSGSATSTLESATLQSNIQSLTSSSSLLPNLQIEYSTNPAIAKLQEEYVARYQELQKEKAWLTQVNDVISDYKKKTEGVRHHSVQEGDILTNMRRNIARLIREDKEQKLQQQLQQAVDAVKKLEKTAATLTGKVEEVHEQKSSLKNTIKKIQMALGRVPEEDLSAALPRFREVLGSSPEASKLFASLVELVSNRNKANDNNDNNEEVLPTNNHKHKAPIAHVLKRKAQSDEPQFGSIAFETQFDKLLEETTRDLD